MVASRCPQRFSGGLDQRPTSVSVRYSRVRSSAFERRRGVTVRFTVVGTTTRRAGFINVSRLGWG